MKIENFKDLQIWQFAIKLIVKVYKLLASFPAEEKFGLIAQCKDSVVSVAANIAEGWGRYHFKDRIKFLYNSRGSLFETESHLITGKNLGFINENNIVLYNEVINDIKNLGVKINNTINSLNSSNNKVSRK